jgi:hypothetical protein
MGVRIRVRWEDLHLHSDQDEIAVRGNQLPGEFERVPADPLAADAYNHVVEHLIGLEDVRIVVELRRRSSGLTVRR